MTTAAISLPRRAWSLATGFPGLHALNMVLAIGFTLLQTLIFARVLPQHLFSQTVAATAVGLYTLPLNQSVARANFVLFRQHMVRTASAAGLPEASAALYANQVLLLLISLGVPPLLGATDPVSYTSLACYLFLCTYTNIWVTEVQMTMLATDRALQFEYINTVRRLLIYATVIWLYFRRDFLLFNLAAAAQTAAFHIYGLSFIGRDQRLFARPRGLTRADARAHGHRFWVSLQATFAEWLTLNAPYAIFTARFGIGPGLIAIDTVLKLIRVVVSITRNMSEIALPRVSRAVLSGAPSAARSAVWMVLGAGFAGAGVLALASLIDGRLLFSLLLGPNNTVPPGAGAPAALALLAAVAFATGGTLIGHTGDPRSIRIFMFAPVVAATALGAAVLALPITVLGALWVFSAGLALVSVVSLWLLLRLVRHGVAHPVPQPEPQLAQ